MCLFGTVSEFVKNLWNLQMLKNEGIKANFVIVRVMCLCDEASEAFESSLPMCFFRFEWVFAVYFTFVLNVLLQCACLDDWSYLRVVQ